ncbi:MAG: phage minor capsid protein, partial [Sporomusa sp.]
FREAIEQIAKDGITVTYPSGHTDTIETATLRAVRTGISQATGSIQVARMEEMDWDIISVSSHMGARTAPAEDATNHAWWQGKFYSRTGKTEGLPLFSVTGFGTGPGLCGWNCRHSFGAGDGENNPFDQYDSEENKKAYELSQRQRLLERRVRKTKREVMALQSAVDATKDDKLKFDLQQDLDKKSHLLQKQNKAYNQFCEDNELKKLQERLKIAEWNREAAAKARGAARRYENAKQ